MESEALEWVGDSESRVAISPFMREGLTRENIETIHDLIEPAEDVAA